MADLANLATEVIEQERRHTLATFRKPVPVLPSTGYCANCGEALNAVARWCDAECRDDWEKYGQWI